jgi:hypothetical protein
MRRDALRRSEPRTRCTPAADRLAGLGYGFRVHDMLPTSGADQLNVVFDDGTGQVRGLATGTWLGDTRTGAIGAVVVDLLADPVLRWSLPATSWYPSCSAKDTRRGPRRPAVANATGT